jgi:hypothetical protein
MTSASGRGAGAGATAAVGDPVALVHTLYE